jgi:hypothetical protein
MTVHKDIVLSSTGAVFRYISAALFSENHFCHLRCDVDGYGVYALRIDVEGEKEDASSTDHRCHDGTFKWKGWNLQGYPMSGAKRIPMICREARLRALKLKNKKTGFIRRWVYSAGERREL